MALKTSRALSAKGAPHFPEFGHYVAEGCTIFRGSISAVCEDGTIVPAGQSNPPSPIVAIVGISRQEKIGSDPNAPSGTDGPVWVKKGCFALPFDKDPTWADIGKDVFALDDETVTLTQKASRSDGNPTGAPLLKVGTLAGIDLDGSIFTFIS